MTTTARHESTQHLRHLANRLTDYREELADSLHDLAVSLKGSGYMDEEPLFREAIEIRRKILGDDHPDTVAAVHSFGVWLCDRGHPDAVRILREVVSRRDAARGGGGDLELAESLLICTPADMIDKLGPYAQAGIDRVILHVNLGARQAETLDCVQRFAEEVMPHLTDSAGPAIEVEAVE